MLVCSVCNEDVFDNEDIKCSKCKMFFHFACAGFREVNFRKMSASNKMKWFCVNCKDFNSESGAVVNQVKNCSHSDKILSDLKDSVNFLSEKFDDFKSQLSDIIKSINDVRLENKQLKEQNQKLINEMSVVNKKINFVEQKIFENHIEIVGVPEQENEDCCKIVEEMSLALGEAVSVTSAYRYRSKVPNKIGKIVAVLSSYKNKKSLMEMSRKKKLKAKNVNANWNDEGIYINNYLTQANNNLFYKTRLFAKAHNYKYVWFRDSKLFLRKDENNKVILIEDENSLKILYNN